MIPMKKQEAKLEVSSFAGVRALLGNVAKVTHAVSTVRKKLGYAFGSSLYVANKPEIL